jgi:xanthine dehydrogenase accessory factor
LGYFDELKVLVLGGGDLASGVIFRLHQGGFRMLVTELERPLFVRRTVCYGDAIYRDTVSVEGVIAQRIHTHEAVSEVWRENQIPIIIDPTAVSIHRWQPHILIDARMEKRNLGVRRHDADYVIGLGPGFVAGEDVHAVVETQRGHTLGRVIYQGAAIPDSGTPGSVNGHQSTRVLRSPDTGFVEPFVEIGQIVQQGQKLAQVGNHPLHAPFDGVLRGLIHPSVYTTPHMKIGDLDPRADASACYTISDKSLAMGGGVLEAVLVGLRHS